MDSLLNEILCAKTPESLFGKNINEATLKTSYRNLAKQVHPDKFRNNSNYEKAQEAFIKLSELRDEAERKLETGEYGKPSKLKTEFSVNIDGKFYYIKEKVFSGGISDIHRCRFGTKDYLVKIAKSSSYNEFIQNETIILNELKLVALHDYSKFELFARSIASFTLLGDDPRDAVVLRWDKGFHSLADILAKNPRGVGVANTLEIINRLWLSLEFTHNQEIYHGSIVPSHFIINPSKSAGKLLDWGSAYDAYRSHKPRRAIKEEYLYYYPRDRFPSPENDIYMVGKCALALLGGNIRDNSCPDSVPKKLYDFLTWCLMDIYVRRPRSVPDLYPEFQWVCKNLADYKAERFKL